jgi:hypothetical protein
MHISRRVRRGIAVATAALLMLGGCGGGGSDDAAVIAPPPVGGPSPPPPSDTVVKHRVSGSVGDGPIVGARIRVYANSGLLLQETVSSITADYELTVNAHSGLYPLTIVADQGTDLVTGRPPDFKLSYALYRLAEQTTINLNPFRRWSSRSPGRMAGSTTRPSSLRAMPWSAATASDSTTRCFPIPSRHSSTTATSTT